MIKRLVPFLLFSVIFISDAVPQNFEEWRRQYLQEYQQFRDQRDSLFTDMLNRHWAQFEAFKAGDVWEEPKISTPPDAVTVARPRTGATLPEDDIPRVIFDLPDFGSDEPLPLPPSPPARSATASLFETGFYNDDVRVLAPQEILKMTVPSSFNRNSIAEFWEQMSRSDYQQTRNSYAEERDRLGLNDWGFAKLLFQSAENLYRDHNMAYLYTWFFLSKSGYHVRVGYEQNSVYLMLPVQETLFAASFFQIDGLRYYVAGLGKQHPQPGALYTYEGTYPDADLLLSTSKERVPRFQRDVYTRNLSFDYQGETHSFAIPVNKNLIAYYEYYPQTDFEVYFGAPVSSLTGQALLDALRPILEGKSQTEAVNILLRFVQTAFDYKTDPEQFGREKPMFPEETIYYPYSDCEDRAILFSYLVRHLTGLEVVGLHYPGHVATAVQFTTPVEGDYITIDGERWIICDPTYINATLGMEMPNFKGKEAVVIRVR